MIGSTISHYHVLSELGRGGMGIVYKAEDTKLDRAVALKFLPTPLVADPVARDRFVQEAKAASILDHQNICTIHEIGESEDGQVFIAMACYDGLSLKAKINGMPLPIDEALNYGMQAAEGLSVAHAAGIIHRDIKPGNLMVTSRNVIKILDFGLAKMTDATLTTSGTRLGTVIYMSPEQARGERVDHRTDIWSLGAVLYEMLTGVKPFEAPYESAVFYAIINADPKPPREYNPQIPELVQDIVLKCLSKEPLDRFESASELVADLSRVAGDSKLDMDSVSKRGSVLSFGRSRRTRVGSAVAAFLIVIFAFSPVRKIIFSGADTLPLVLSVGILPTLDENLDSTESAFIQGIVHLISSLASDMEQDHPSLWVAAYADMIWRNVQTPEEAVGIFFVNLVLRPDIEIIGDDVRIALFLEDGRTQRVIRQTRFSSLLAPTSAFLDNLIRSLAEVLEIDLTTDRVESLKAGMPTNSVAFRAYLEGEGYLRQYDDEASLDRAISNFERSSSRDSTFARVWTSLATADIRKYSASNESKWIDRAQKNLDYAIDAAPGLSNSNYLKGIVLSMKGDGVGAEELYRRVLKENPKHRRAYLALASLLDGQNRILDAENIYLDAIDNNKGYWQFYNNLGLLYSTESRHLEAVPLFERVIELSDNNTWGYVNLALQYLRLENDIAAESLFVEATTINPIEKYAMALAFYNLGEIRYRRDEFEAAAGFYEQSLRLDSTNFSAWSDLGNAYYWENQREAAIVTWNQLVNLAETELSRNRVSVEALEYLALTHARLGNTEPALDAIERLSNQPRISAEENISIGKAFEILNMRDEAFVYINQALDEDYSIGALNASRWLDGLREDRRYLCRTEGEPCVE